VIGDTDEADLTLVFGFKHGFIQTRAVTGFGAKRGIVELIYVNIVGLQK
jgi:hypothetical protein